jgi:hypothetical protein
MFAAHLAAGLAIKSRAPQAPTWALLLGAFLPDLIWIPLAALGVEPAATAVFFDDWSHSLATTVVWAALFAALFWRRCGASVAVAIGLAVVSHFLLDLPIHPRPLALYPHSALRLSLGLGAAARASYWWLQLAVVAALALVYIQGARRQEVPARLIAASVLVVVSMHLLLR